MKLSFQLAAILALAGSFEGNAAIYEGQASYEGREIRIYGELNIPNYLTSEAVTVESETHAVDPYHSDEVTYSCTTSVEFQGATVLLEVEDAKTGEQLMFVDEEPASLRGRVSTYSNEKVECKEVDFSKQEVRLAFSSDAALHLPIAKKDGYDVSLALYPLLTNQASLNLEKEGDRYVLETSKWENKLKRVLEVPILHWGGATREVGSVPLTYLRAQ